MDKLTLKKEILSKIERPCIRDKAFNAKDFGIEPNTDEILTDRIQGAIDTISREGGGRLVFPSGTYRTGSIFLKSHVEVRLEAKDSILSFVFEALETNYPIRFSHWEASPCYNYSALIYSYGESDIALTGPGMLDGGASREGWWSFHHQVENSWSTNDVDLQKKARGELRRMNQNGTPIKERVFGDGHYLRPNFIQTIKCERVLLSGFSLRNSPMWQLNPVMCKSVIIENLDLKSHGPNNDGCDPESCDGVIIKGCRFDTGDDCISLKSGRDRDGRVANIPCKNVYIEDNDFADGHGGIALGSEMSGGLYRICAINNRFSSPNLTYALRMKTNAKRGGTIEDVLLADSTMESVHGAAVHGTMLYEDGRQGDDLPHFRNIHIENIKANGGDYGIFLEAFPEVPITGLEMENITIENADKALRSMNWRDAKVSNVRINGKLFPRPGFVRILGIPRPGEKIEASAENCGGNNTSSFSYLWEGFDGREWKSLSKERELTTPEGVTLLHVIARDEKGEEERSIDYRVLTSSSLGEAEDRLITRGVEISKRPSASPISRHQLAKLLIALADKSKTLSLSDSNARIDEIAAGNKFLPIGKDGLFNGDKTITREEMATVAMQACGVNYRNASSTMPSCNDRDEVQNNYGTNVYRALYFGFMRTDESNNFRPKELVTEKEAVDIINRVADFYGL